MSRLAAIAAAVLALLSAACAGEAGTTSTTVTTTGATTVSTTSTTTSSTPTTTTAPVATTGPGTTTASTAQPTTTTTVALPAVLGPDPSPRVAAFYYPWYGTPGVGGHWVHWDQAAASPPADIGSDYYPELGAYSNLEPAVVGRHMAWLRQAGVGVIVSSWWGQGTYEDRAVPLLLDTAHRYGIGVAFHIEPYGSRTAESVIADIEYLYEQYGSHPAFFRSTDRSRWSDDDRPKGLFFVWSAERPHEGMDYVDPGYWRDAVDAVHALPDGALVIADNPSGAWVDGGHFDGLYQYATLETDPDFGWARTLPPDAWYIPSVLPGFSARRIGYDPSTTTRRAGGDTYRNQWQAALGTGIEPKMVTITSFNEWHEGTQIEPAVGGQVRSGDDRYLGYGALGPEGYLDLTADFSSGYLATDWTALRPQRVRLRVTTTSDWTTVTVVSGGILVQPELVALTGTAEFGFEGPDGGRLALLQPLGDAEAGTTVELTIDVGILDLADVVTIRIERGGLGWTEVGIGPPDGPEIAERWAGGNETLVDGEAGRNPHEFSVDREALGG